MHWQKVQTDVEYIQNRQYLICTCEYFAGNKGASKTKIMKTLILTSKLDAYTEENGQKTAKNFGNEKNILDNIKTNTKKFDNFVFVASDFQDTKTNELYANVIFKSFDLTCPFKNYVLLDERNADQAEQILKNADLIYLSGGHVPTQNAYFAKYNLAKYIKKSKALVVGVSAGSMNCANIVYAQPELAGESVDKKYKRYLRGLGLTKISILPHFDFSKHPRLDGKSIFENLCLPDSKKRPFIAIPDGSYILQQDGKIWIYGKSHLFANGECKTLSANNQTKDITALINNLYQK